MTNHQMRITGSIHDEGDSRYQPVCSCGWTGQVWTTTQDAARNRDEHLLAIMRVIV